MDIERFKALVNKPEYGCKELKRLFLNAKAKGESEFAKIAEEALNKRCSNWKGSGAKSSGKRATHVFFRGTVYNSTDSKEAYLWLIERFIKEQPEFFSATEFDTLYVQKGLKRMQRGTEARLDFARSPQALFRQSPHLADDPNNSARLSNGWHVNANVNNANKLDVLIRYAGMLELKWKTDWIWRPERPTPELAKRLELLDNPMKDDVFD